MCEGALKQTPGLRILQAGTAHPGFEIPGSATDTTLNTVLNDNLLLSPDIAIFDNF